MAADTTAIKRLTQDLRELAENPIENVSAEPLPENIFEWHCNFAQSGGTYHLVLYFPPNYPAKSPSAEFVPSFSFSGGATKTGPKGGTQVCLSIFSDFAIYHTEWANEKGTGWSPSYTVQTVLLNLVSFINERSSSGNAALAQAFVCKDCGHSHASPKPPLPTAEELQAATKRTAAKAATAVTATATTASASTNSAVSEFIKCYVSKVEFLSAPPATVFGFGINKSGTPYNPSLTSPCEFMTYDSFQMLKASGRVESVMREELHFFIPQYINAAHGATIAPLFEAACVSITGSPKFTAQLVLQVLPKLMNSSVVAFMNGTTFTSERALHGYFFFHRLFLWAVYEKYPELLPLVTQAVSDFVSNPAMRLKSNCPNLGEWLTYLTVVNDPALQWKNICQPVIQETFERNVMWYVATNPQLADTNNATVNANRVGVTFGATKVSRDLMAFQTRFLDVAKPASMQPQQIAARYDANYGLPTAEMQQGMQAVCAKIKSVSNYNEWFSVIQAPSPKNLCAVLCESVTSSMSKPGYTKTGKGGRGGGGNNNNQGGGRGRGRGRGRGN
ncbi:Ubiquitinconjugating enzyme subfamily protein [Pelomyxa schiedti]|nr:Ubiquitinconjugating enzyme subfamily protein [Pelomyxa schiedti]